MIYIRIELWPYGDRTQARAIGEAFIANDGSGSSTRGSYDVRLMKSPEYAKQPGLWKRGRIEEFPRQRLGPWDLLFRALRACVADRNKEQGAPR